MSACTANAVHSDQTAMAGDQRAEEHTDHTRGAHVGEGMCVTRARAQRCSRPPTCPRRAQVAATTCIDGSAAARVLAGVKEDCAGSERRHLRGPVHVLWMHLENRCTCCICGSCSCRAHKDRCCYRTADPASLLHPPCDTTTVCETILFPSSALPPRSR